MVDAQNERTNSKNRRRGRRRNRDRQPVAPIVEQQRQSPDVQQPEQEAAATPATKPWTRPADMEPPTVPSEEYCVHHMASHIEMEPMQERFNMTTLRHLRVDTFGEAILYCDCLHNGPHEWPPSMQKIETAIELDQFRTASTNET